MVYAVTLQPHVVAKDKKDNNIYNMDFAELSLSALVDFYHHRDDTIPAGATVDLVGTVLAAFGTVDPKYTVLINRGGFECSVSMHFLNNGGKNIGPIILPLPAHSILSFPDINWFDEDFLITNEGTEDVQVGIYLFGVYVPGAP